MLIDTELVVPPYVRDGNVCRSVHNSDGKEWVRILVDSSGKEWVPKLGKGIYSCGKSYPCGYFRGPDRASSKEIELSLPSGPRNVAASEFKYKLISEEPGFDGLLQVT